jgi:hypothetical protein
MKHHLKQYASTKKPIAIVKLFASDDVRHIIAPARLNVIAQIANIAT